MSPFHNMGRILRDVYEQHQLKWDKYDQNQYKPQQPTLKKPDIPRLGGLWSAFGFEEAAEQYKQRLEEQYGFLHIFGHHKPVPLEGVFTDVYLYDRPLALRRLEVAELEEQFRQRRAEQKGTKRLDGLSLVRRERKLFILGQPGAGKTTFLKHIALQAAKGELPGVPVFIALKALADSELPLLNFMAQEMRICGFPEPVPFIQLMLQMGKLLILLDGLDEVTQAQEIRLNLMQGIENVIRQYGNNHFLITCRTAVTDYQFPRFTSVEMADFSLEQVAVFIQKWFQNDLVTGKACLQELNQAHLKGLRDMARTPLLLNLLCLTYDELGHFPRRRVGLYEEAVNVLLVKWDNSRRIRREEIYRQLDLGRKRHLLARVAAATFGQGKYFISKIEMVQHILTYLRTIPGTEQLSEGDGEAVLQAIEAQHGILVERARGVYGFAHLTFQEYFTARYVIEAGQKTWTNLFLHCSEVQWREVFLLTTSLLNEADEFFTRFCTHLDRVISRDPQEVALLTWVNSKVNYIGETIPSLILYRSLYLGLARTLEMSNTFDLDHSRSLDIILDIPRILDFAFDFARDHSFDIPFALNHELDSYRIRNALVRALTRPLARARAIDLERARDLAMSLISTLTRALALALALTMPLNPLAALDFALVCGWFYGRFGLALPFVEVAYRISQEHGSQSLQDALERLVVPSEDALRTRREKFLAELWQVTQQERQLQLFELTEVQAQDLVDYLQGTRLLVDCLKLAAVKDREGIMARLLVPPGAA